MQQARAFLAGIVDYAGLFPPAALSMVDAVKSYAEFLAGPDRDLLGRFVVPLSRIDEFSACAPDFLGQHQGDPWRLSATAGADVPIDDARNSLLAFNRTHSPASAAGHAICDAFEFPVTSMTRIAEAIRTLPESFSLFMEVPTDSDPEPLISAMSGTRGAAKIRTGGTTPDSIPRVAEVVRFMRACHEHRVPFKATAGLHHALRGGYSLTYETDSPCAEMFGFLNVFLGAAFLHAGTDDDSVTGVLEERARSAFVFDDDGVTWRGKRLSTDQLTTTRRSFALSYGSCSFTEPVAEARDLGIL